MTNDELAFAPQDLLEHRPWVRALARSLVRDPALADDLEQDTWVRALTRTPEAPRSPRAWLATVMRNRLRDVRRGDERRGAREERAARADAPPSPAELAAQADTHRHLIGCVLDLDPRYRDAVLLRYFEGLSPGEAGERLGVPASTVRTRTQRGLAQLRERLDTEHGSDGRSWRLALAPLLAGAGARRTARRAAITSLAGGSAWLLWVGAAVLAVLAWTFAFPGDEDGGGRGAGGGATAAASDGAGRVDGETASPASRGRRERDAGDDPSPNGAESTASGGGGMAFLDDDGEDGGEAPALPRTVVVEVVRADGSPAASVDVELLEGGSGTDPRKRLAAGTTGEDGRIDLGRPDGHFGWVFALDGNHAAVHAVFIRKDPAVRLNLERAERLRVLVLGPDGEAIRGAGLELSVTVDRTAGGALSARTDANGRATFRPLPRSVFDGNATLEVRATGYFQAYRGLSLRDVDAGQVEVRLETGNVVSGRCVNAAGEPLSGVEVSCIYADRRVTTGADGHFELTVDRQEVDVRFRSFTIAPRSVRADGDRAPAGVLGDVILRPGRPLRLRVVHEDGSPANRVHVRVLSREVGRDVRSGTTGDEGRLTLTHLGTGLHDVIVSREGEGLDWAAGIQGAVRGIEIGDEEVRVTIGVRHSVLLTYVDEQGNVRTSDHVFLKWSPLGEGKGHTWSIAGRDMRSTRFRPASAGRYGLSVVVEGFAPVDFDDVEITVDTETRLKVPLVPEE